MSGPAGTGGGVDDRGISADPRERVLPGAGGGGTPVRGRSVGRSTAYRWTGTAREEGRRTAKRMGGGPAPRLGGEVESSGAGRAGVDRSADPGGVPRPPGRADRRAGTALGRGPWAGRRGGPDVKRRSLPARGRAGPRGCGGARQAGWSADAGGGRRGRDRPGAAGLPRRVRRDDGHGRPHGRSPRAGKQAGARHHACRAGAGPNGGLGAALPRGALSIGGIVAATGVEAATDGAVSRA